MFMSARGGAKGSLERSYLILMATRFYDPVRSKSTEHGFTLWNCESTMINTAVEPCGTSTSHCWVRAAGEEVCNCVRNLEVVQKQHAALCCDSLYGDRSIVCVCVSFTQAACHSSAGLDIHCVLGPSIGINVHFFLIGLCNKGDATASRGRCQMCQTSRRDTFRETARC